MSTFDEAKRKGYNGKIYVLMPALGDDEEDCKGCTFHTRGEMCRGLGLGCGDSVAVEDTPEGLAKYIAARMTT